MKSANILAKLIGSANRVKLLRLFLLNEDKIFSPKDMCRRAKVTKPAGRREIALLKSVGFIKAGSKFVEIKVKGKKRRPKKKRIYGWKLNEDFPLILGLKNFILDTAPLSRDQIVKKLQKAGRIKLIILAGVFGKNSSSRIDILVVGDSIRRGILEKAVRDIEAEMGKELTYAAFETDDFIYRLGMYDKFIRDILDYPHEKILNKLGI